MFQGKLSIKVFGFCLQKDALVLIRNLVASKKCSNGAWVNTSFVEI